MDWSLILRSLFDHTDSGLADVLVAGVLLKELHQLRIGCAHGLAGRGLNLERPVANRAAASERDTTFNAGNNESTSAGLHDAYYAATSYARLPVREISTCTTI